MDINKITNQQIEIYKCIVLTIITLLLLGIFVKMPTPFTMQNVRAKKVEMQDIPVVFVKGGSLDVEVTNIPLEVEGTVSID